MKRAALAFALLTVAMTWPMAAHLATQAPPHQDVFFNMWRLRWFAHALVTSPAHLFDANIFYPERNTLAFSDAMPVEGIIAAPLIWAGLKPVLVQNLMILLPIAASGLAMFALARYLTRSRGAAMIAGVAFAYAPYRFEHLMHMELQWTVWMPLAFLALHRTLDTGRWKYGLATGACVALQMLSCIYYGIFLASLLGLAGLLLLVSDRAVTLKAATLPLAAGALLAAAVCGSYALPYGHVHQRVGDRGVMEIGEFSARPFNYVNVPEENRLYGNPGRPGRPERRLFPGTIVILLAITGLLLRKPGPRAIVYLVIVVAAFETSLAFAGFSYPVLYRFVPLFRGLRAMSRLGIFVVMGLSVLAAFGYAALTEQMRAGRRRALAVVVIALLAVEYSTRVRLTPFPNAPEPVYRILAGQPPGVVAEVPMPEPAALPGLDPQRIYMSSFAWFPTVNGYSGNFPPSYILRLDRMHGFPDAPSLAQLRRDGVRYLIVHREFYSGKELAAIRTALDAAGMVELGTFGSLDERASLYIAR